MAFMPLLLTTYHPKFLAYHLKGNEVIMTASEFDLNQLFFHLGTVFRNSVKKPLLFLKI